MRVLVLGDVHIHAGSDRTASEDFAALVASTLRAGPFRLILSGDVYDLAVAGAGRLEDRLAAIDAWHPRFHEALRSVLAEGGEVVFVPGNHDAEMATPEGRRFWALHVPGARIEPWFHRIPGVVHVEHGHQYDPDNAHPHPLAPDDDPLGVLLTRRILSRLGDLVLLRHSLSTPIPVLAQCVVSYGLRTPIMVAYYVWLSLRAILRGGRGHAEARRTGHARARELAAERGLDPALLERHASLSATTTLENRGALARRLYLDRLFCSFAFVGVLCAAALGLVRLGSGAAAGLLVGAVLLGTILSPNRYRTRVHDRLREAAHRIAGLTGAPRVVFGHAHQVSDDGVYVNTGSFGLPPRGAGRSWVEIHEGRLGHRTMRPGEAPPPPTEAIELAA